MPWSLDTCSTQHSPVHRVQTHGASNRDTHLYPPHNNSSVYLTTTTYVRRSGRITNGTRSGRTTLLDSVISSLPLAPPSLNGLPKNSVGLRTDVGRFRSCWYKWGMSSSAACECGADKQTVDHVVLQCPIHRPPHGLHGQMVLDDETIEWLLNTAPRSSAN